VAAVNIEEMLQLHDPEIVEPGVHQPLYPSEDGGGFIPAFASKKIRKIFKTAKEESWTAERLVDVHVDEGVTQGKARSTFIMFDVAGVVLAIIIILIFFGY
jgi:hypothetical protein